MSDAESLPQAHIKRIVKAKLAELTSGEGEQKREVSVQKEALLAFAESAKIFIHYLTATANDVCHESKRLTINAEDVMKAIDEVEFHEFAEPLREALAGASAPGGFGRTARREASRKRQSAAACACVLSQAARVSADARLGRVLCAGFKAANAEKAQKNAAAKEKKRKAEGEADDADAGAAGGAGADDGEAAALSLPDDALDEEEEEAEDEE
jgi:DNA polymerase epsilon subunit 3